MSILDYFRSKPEQRDIDPSWSALSNFGQYGGPVSPVAAENLSTVLCAVNCVSSAIASLPVWIYQQRGDRRDVITDHPLNRLIKRGANEHQSWSDFIEWLMSSVLLRGNGVARIVHDRAGRITELCPVPWDQCNVTLLPSGQLRYDITLANGQVMRLGAEDLVHVRDRSDDGIVGRSRLSRAAGAVRTSMAIQEYSEHIYSNGARPSGVLSHPERLSKEQTDYLRTQFEALHAGTGNAGRAVVLSSGIEFKPISFSPEDSELLSSRRFATEEIARVFGVPLPLLNIWDHSSFTNSEQAQRWFSSFTLQPWCRKLELEILRSCFTEMEDDLILEFDLSGHLRGDHAQRWAGYKIAVDAGILDVNEVRLSEGWSPREKEVNADA